jgi:hypothetical protein
MRARELPRLGVIMLVGAVASVCPRGALAADTQVSCVAPIMEIDTGADGTAPRATVYCSGGAKTSSGNTSVVYYTYAFSGNPGNPAVAQSIVEFIGFNNMLLGKTSTITIYSDFSVSAVPNGCGPANCRMIDHIFGE